MSSVDLMHQCTQLVFDSVVRRVTSVARLAASELVSRVDRFVDVD